MVGAARLCGAKFLARVGPRQNIGGAEGVNEYSKIVAWTFSRTHTPTHTPFAMGKAKTKAKTATSSSTPRVINGFHVLPLAYPNSAAHYLYLRADKSKAVGSSSSSALPSKRTLFVVNLPPDATSRHLRHIFEKAGRIEDVRINKRGFGAAEQAETVEEVGDDDDDEAMLSDSGDEEEQEEQEMTTSQPQKTKKQLKREAASRPKIPELHALPHLNPRREHGFLRTGSTAHVVFLEEGSVEKALSLAASSKPTKWTDPWEEIQRKVAASRAGEDDEDADESSTRRKKPTTALEAQARALTEQDPPPPMGLACFLQSYNTHRPSLSTLKKHADSIIARYTFFRSHPNLNPENQRRASQGYGIGSQVGGITIASWGPEGEPLDEDGFTIVLPGGKYGRSLTQSSTTASVPASGHATTKMARTSLLDQEAIRLKQEKKMEGLEDFYRFQNREKRKEKLVQMRKQFEEDREKVQKLKEKGGGGRRFRPY